MECFLQYLDDLDDFVYATALLWERILHISTFMILVTGSVAVQALGVYLALTAPPPAVAVVFVLLGIAGIIGFRRYHKKKIPPVQN